MSRLFFLLCAALAGAAACSETAAPTPDPDVSMRISWLGPEPSATLPDTVVSLRMGVFDPADAPMPDESISTVANLDDADDDGHPELVRRRLPTDTPIRLLVQGLDAGDATLYQSHIGPFTLFPGERRLIDVTMWRTDVSVATITPGNAARRFLHTGTPLPDGRVLIAGGFDQAAPTTCPGALPAESRCFAVTATADAQLFEPSTGRFHPVQGGMLVPRAGHTATALPDGRVLILGGTPRAVFVLVPQAGGVTSGYAPDWLPPADAGAGAVAHASFEIFDPTANPQLEDLEGDGDPGAGAFFGAADAPDFPGTMNEPRFLHAASPVPGTPSQVFVVGGDPLGAGAASTSYEVFDYDRPGGHGFYDPTGNVLGRSRRFPGAIGLVDPERVWILGGNAAIGNDDLAEIWTPSTSVPGGGTVENATAMTAFPGQEMDDEAPHPELALLSPVMLPTDTGIFALVVGWMGPRCALGGTDVLFPMDMMATELCGPEATPRARAFTLNNSTGTIVPTPTSEARAFPAATILDDGSPLITGGVTTLNWVRGMQLEAYDARALGSSMALVARRGDNVHAMRTGRVFHTTTALRAHGMLTVGGVSFSTDLSTITIVGEPEVFTFAYPSGG